ncbi:SGNH/GDSL hydrolase family protein [Ideonella sp.]|uniref:SGNH/GDSL hydrolase family protein n=1 Tax=Ideonella sp. TaxID=1929293 RepID=UPI0035AFE62D
MSLLRLAFPLFFRPARLAVAAAMGLGLLAGCGGGSSQVDEFVPERLLVFGDELSVITPDGRKYTTNTVDDNGIYKCDNSPIWVQNLAGHYDFVFAECNPDAIGNPQAKMLARVGANSDGLADQVRAFSTGDSIRPNDLATVLVGMNDVLEAYDAFPTESEEVLVGRIKAAGVRVAHQVNELAAAGARVLVSTVPDMGLTPFARSEDIEFGNARSRLLTRLSSEFNTAMRLELVNDGSKLGLLMLDDLMRAMHRVPGVYSLVDVDNAVCLESAPLPDCSNATLVERSGTAATGSNYLWADAYRPALSMHSQLGSQAIRRATSNPF